MPALIETLVFAVMLWGEAIAVKADAVIKIGKTWFIRVKRTYAEVAHKPVLREYGKTANATRNISILENLARRLLAGVGPDGFVFRPRRSAFLDRSKFREIFQTACRKAGITGLRVHDYADTCVMPMSGRSAWSAVVSGLEVSA